MINKLPVLSIEELELHYDLEYHKLLNPEYNLYVGLLYRDHVMDHRMHFDVIFWRNEVSNNCVLDDFSPSPLTSDSDEWLNQAAIMCISMGFQASYISDTNDPDNKGFIESCEALQSIGLSAFDIEQLDCIMQDLEE